MIKYQHTRSYFTITVKQKVGLYYLPNDSTSKKTRLSVHFFRDVGGITTETMKKGYLLFDITFFI